MASSREESDYDSSCSSFTAPDSRRSWISDASLACSSTLSVRSYGGGEAAAAAAHKPHKATQAEWEAIRSLRSAAPGGRLGLDHFRLVRLLGSGDLGNVYLCRLRHPSPLLFAMKVVDRDALAFKKKLQRAETERDILRSLDHPFLPTLYADFDASRYSCFVMEFCPGGDLHAARQRLPSRRFPLSSAKFYAAETILAVEYLHMMGVVYRDLKPENVLVRDDGHIMLSDFDLSLRCHVVPKLLKQRLAAAKGTTAKSSGAGGCVPPMQSCFSRSGSKKKKDRATAAEAEEKGDEVNDDQTETELVAEPISARSKSFVGTHEYLAPEVISGAGHGSAVDWWTLGVFLYEMMYGRTPFKGEDNEGTLTNIVKQPLSFPRLPAAASAREAEEAARAQDLIARLLVKNPKRRLGSARGSVEIKRHEFFKGVNWALIRSVRPPEVPRDMRRVRCRAAAPPVLRLSRKEREEPFNIPQRIDYF